MLQLIMGQNLLKQTDLSGLRIGHMDRQTEWSDGLEYIEQCPFKQTDV